MKIYKLLPLLLIFLSTTASSLGANGHRIVAEIAQQNLKPEALKALMALTGGYPLAKLSTWPDEIKADKTWNFAKPWHYISIDDDESFHNLKRSDKGDIWSALEKFEKQLMDKSLSDEKRWQALAFYIHFIGDIHQPLHVGNRSDRGANDVKVKWFGQPSNLHRVWDSGLIENQQLSYSEYVDMLNHTSAEQNKIWQGASYLNYLEESKKLRTQAYEIGEEAELSYQYTFVHKPTIEKQMVKAGMRLAGRLNDIFGN